MKMLCIDNKTLSSSVYAYLTINKIYEVHFIDTDWIFITNDVGKDLYVPREWFLPLEEYRDKKLEKLGI